LAIFDSIDIAVVTSTEPEPLEWILIEAMMAKKTSYYLLIMEG
jgi:hypothetical protein